jgi:nucleoid DNA-binding protein
MNKSDLSTRLAKQARVSKAQAADQVDRVVHQIVRNLRRGQPVRFPGLGSFHPGEKWQFQFDAQPRAGGKRGGK